MLRERIEPFNGYVVFTRTGIAPALAHNLGRLDHLLDRYDEADAWFVQADAIHRRLEAPVLVAHSDVGRAALLADRARGDDLVRARALTTSALEVAELRGCGYVEADAHAVLARLG